MGRLASRRIAWGGCPFVLFNASTTVIDCGSGVSVDNFATAGVMTVDGWFRIDGVGEGNANYLITKINNGGASGWMLWEDSANHRLSALLVGAGGGGDASSAVSYQLKDRAWHHVCLAYDDTGDRKLYLAIDGNWAAAYVAQVAAGAAPADDSAEKLMIGNRAANDHTLNGAAGWVRLSNYDRYSYGLPGVNFEPPPRCEYPPLDEHSVVLLTMEEGGGTSVVDKSSNHNNGTISAGLWGEE